MPARRGMAHGKCNQMHAQELRVTALGEVPHLSGIEFEALAEGAKVFKYSHGFSSF